SPAPFRHEFPQKPSQPVGWARRQSLDHELDDELAKFPEYWVTRDCPQPFHNIVECGTEELTHVQEIMDRTMYAPGEAPHRCKIQKLLRVEDSKMWNTYERSVACLAEARTQEARAEVIRTPHSGTECPRPLTWRVASDDFRSRLRLECNEAYLWHGTDRKSAESIIGHHFDMKRAGTVNAKALGRGAYFAETSFLADKYAPEGQDGLRAVLLVRAALGRVYVETRRFDIGGFWHQIGLAFVPSRRSEAPLRRSRLALSARKRSQDLLSGETFSRKAVFLLETEQPGLQTLIFGSAFVAVTSFFGLVYNGLGQLALLTSAGAKPGLDEPTVLFGEAVLVLLSAFGFSTLSRARTERLRRMDAELRFSALPLKLTDGTGLERRLSELASKRRVVVLFAPTEEELQESLTLAKAYRRRWETSQALVVAVGPAGNSLGGKWLAIAQRPEVWEQCYGALQAATGREPVDEASWLLFGKSGRLRGESTGRDFDQVLAFMGVTQDLSLLPQLCGEAEEDILKVHDTFYEALKGGDAEIMKTLWVEDAGGDNDPRPRVSWSSVLSDKV
ncbi:unnamed protein product, partial [Effrenium voratum]